MSPLRPDPPFLELHYYVGEPGLQPALSALGLNPPQPAVHEMFYSGAVGIASIEQLAWQNDLVFARTEGEAFCGPWRDNRRRLNKLGGIAYRRFVELAELFDCYYGAILVEYSLERPEELRQEHRSLAFINFYLSNRLGTGALRDAVRFAGPGAFVQRLNTGIYVSMTGEFNPESRSVDWEAASWRSLDIATVVSRVWDAPHKGE